MPLIKSSDFNPPRFAADSHRQTMIPALARKVKFHRPEQERVETPDDDFFDVDWYTQSSETVVIIMHGLEGHSRRAYIRGMARAAFDRGWDVAAMNFRSCSGVPNKQLRFYHSGETTDIRFLVEKIDNSNKYNNIALVGFSLGGNVLLKYLGELGDQHPSSLKCAMAISAPVDLKASAEIMERWDNRLYLKRFIRLLKKKVETKESLFPGQISSEHYEQVKTFRDFDDRYTSVIHGFKNADDYYEKCSSIKGLPNIRIPTLLLSALDDTIIGQGSIPTHEAEMSDYLFLEAPQKGGHTGFWEGKDLYYHERRMIEFFKEYIACG